MRPTKDLGTAAQRLAELLGYDLERVGRKVVIRRPSDPAEHTPCRYSPAAALAMMAEEAMMSRRAGGRGYSPQDLQHRIRWTGRLPARGLPGWMEMSLRRLQDFPP